MKPDEFTVKCFPRGDANWEFEYPEDRLLPLKGVITDDLMRAPDMWNSDGESCLLVSKRGSATGTTLGRANGIFSIVRDYFSDMSINQASMEWGIINYDMQQVGRLFRNLAIRAQSSPTSVAVSVACLPAVLVRPRPPT